MGATDRGLHAELIRRIRELAEGKGFSINRLADFSGLSRGYVSKMMRGQQRPTVRTLEKLALALDVETIIAFRPLPPEDA